MSLHDELCQPFDYGTLAHTRLTYQHGIVLLTSAKNFAQTHNFALASYHGIKLSLGSRFGEVGAEVVEHGSL